jgi:hypothetical protein
MTALNSPDCTLRPDDLLCIPDACGRARHKVCRALARGLGVVVGVVILARGDALPAAQLLWHELRLDFEGKLLSWVETGAPYDRIVRNAWAAFKNIPVQADGYRTYFTHPTFYGPNDPAHPPFSGRPWVHNPTGLAAMLTDSAILYHAYSGDRVPLERVREMLDHIIARGTTESTDAWASVPYACANAGQVVYRGADDTIYCDQENHTPCGRGDGVGFLEPDKIGELGYAYLLSEQVNDMDKMSSHTARYASVRVLWYEVSGDRDSKERAFRSFNWATYSSRENGLVKTSLDEGTGYWFSDGYGDYMRHFQRGMASVPEWAAADEDHLLGSTSVVRAVSYGEREVAYVTFDRRSREVLRLRRQPVAVRAATVALPQAKELQSGSQGYSVEPVAQGGFVVRIEHHGSAKVTIRQ